MAQEQPPQDLMNYQAMENDALRGVVKAALRRVATAGLPGSHHFFITFKTRAPGVSGPVDLLARYPDEMTIVVQHQYWDLAPGETFFAITLRFDGEPKNLSIPYAAVTRFYDPSVKFLLTFEVAEPPPAVDQEPEPEPEPTPAGDEPKVVSLDQFRKK
jgi:uncharacterized protein